MGSRSIKVALILSCVIFCAEVVCARELWDRGEKAVGIMYLALTAVDHGIATHELRHSGENKNPFLMEAFRRGRSSGAHTYRVAETIAVFYILDMLPNRARKVGLHVLCGCRMFWIKKSSHWTLSAKIRF